MFEKLTGQSLDPKTVFKIKIVTIGVLAVAGAVVAGVVAYKMGVLGQTVEELIETAEAAEAAAL